MATKRAVRAEGDLNPYHECVLEAFERLGLSRHEGCILLCLLRRRGELRVTDIAEATDINKGEVSAYVRVPDRDGERCSRLHALGLIRRRVEPHGDRKGRDRVFIALAVEPGRLFEELGVRRMEQLEEEKEAVPDLVVDAERSLAGSGILLGLGL